MVGLASLPAFSSKPACELPSILGCQSCPFSKMRMGRALRTRKNSAPKKYHVLERNTGKGPFDTNSITYMKREMDELEKK